MDRLKIFLIGVCLSFALCAQCAENRSVTVLYDNDVHCKISGYAVMAGLRDSLRNNNISTLMVSCGDFVQGGVYGAISKGQYCVDVVNACGYDVITMGNHEFDYGLERSRELMEQLTADVVLANLYDKNNHRLYAPYSIKEIEGVKVAFIGVLTPESFRSEYDVFQDEHGNWLCSLCKDSLVQVVQRNIDEVRAKNADFVVLLTHMGEVKAFKSSELVAQLSGVNAVIDGHSHEIVEGKYIKDADQHDVLLTQTGSGFQKIGKLTLTIADGRKMATSELLDTLGISHSAAIDTVLNKIYVDADPLLKRVIGHTDYDLTINYPDGSRAVRRDETNIANVLCDAFRIVLKTQIGLCNGGSVRASIPKGDILYQHIIDVRPFADNLCLLSVTGRQLMDLLEYSDRKCPVEDGGFMHVSGLQYKIDTTIHNQQNIIDGQLVVIGERRVFAVNVMDKGEWTPIQLDSSYIVATSSYVAGYETLKNATILIDNVMVDQDALVQYIVDSLGGSIPAQYAMVEGRIRFEQIPTGERDVEQNASYDKVLLQGRMYIRKGNSWIDVLGNIIH